MLSKINYSIEGSDRRLSHYCPQIEELGDDEITSIEGASVNRCVNSSGGFPHKFLFYPYPIGIGRSLVDVF